MNGKYSDRNYSMIEDILLMAVIVEQRLFYTSRTQLVANRSLKGAEVMFYCYEARNTHNGIIVIVITIGVVVIVAYSFFFCVCLHTASMDRR